MPPQMTEQYATWLVVATIVDPRNGYTWTEASPRAQTMADFKEAFDTEAEGDARLQEASAKADWKTAMRMLQAASKAYYR